MITSKMCFSAIVFAAVLMAFPYGASLRADDSLSEEIGLEAKPRLTEVGAGSLILVDLKLTNKGQSEIAFTYDKPTERLPVMRDGITFDIRQGKNPVPRFSSCDASTVTSGTFVYTDKLKAGESLTLLGCINWDYVIDMPGTYTGIAYWTFRTGISDSKGRYASTMVLQSSPFVFSVKPVQSTDREAKMAEAEGLLSKKVTYDPQAVEALMSLAFCGTAESAAKLTKIMMGNKRFVTNNSRAALRIALDRLDDNKEALSNGRILLKAADPNLRRAGVHVINTRGTPDDAVVLVALLDDSDYMVKWETCDALKKITDFKPVEPKSIGDERLADVVKQAKAWWAKRAAEQTAGTGN